MTDLALVFAYEPEQAGEIAEYLRYHSGTVVALDFWTEQKLIEKGIPFESCSRYLPTAEEQDALFTEAQAAAREWYRRSEMDFFTHRGIRIAEALESNFDDYLQYVLYHYFVMERALGVNPADRIVIPHPKAAFPQSSPALTAHQLESPVDIARHLASVRGIPIETLGMPYAPDAILPFPQQRKWWHGAFIHAYNVIMAIAARIYPRKPMKIYASEYWSHIAPFIERMDDVELVMRDKSEFRNVSIAQLLRHRVRFVGETETRSRHSRDSAKAQADTFRGAWMRAKPALANAALFSRDGSWWPVVERAFDFMVETYAARVISDIDDMERILRRNRPDIVLLRASVSAQHHFFVIACLARQLGIPSVEVQHAGAIFDPRSIHSRLEASYLAAYGTLTRDELSRSTGCDRSRLRPIGSPRFDPYFSAPMPNESDRKENLQSLGLDPSRPVVLVVVPKEGLGLTLAPWHVTSYDVGALFRTLASAQEQIPEMQLLFKFRRKGYSTQHRAFIEETFPNGSVAAVDSDLFSMMQLSDVVVSGMSSALYEGMIARKPLILYPWKPDTYHKPIYGRIAPIADSDADLVRELGALITDADFRRDRLTSQSRFLEGYSFDGKSWERMSALIREIAG